MGQAGQAGQPATLPGVDFMVTVDACEAENSFCEGTVYSAAPGTAAFARASVCFR